MRSTCVRHGKPLRDVQTPAALLDRDKFERDCARMREHVHALGSHLRPHMRTLKSVEAAHVALDSTHGGIAVATLYRTTCV
jgi:D-serine deaminase-like pyridoxal phosphate-dependent protein